MPPGDSRPSPPSSKDLPERDRRVLALLVREFIEHGEPVSSLWLAGHSGLGVSSATVRNILSRLEEGGYLVQPHTSAGRAPTDRGYRCYVDLLIEGLKPGRWPGDVEARLRSAGTADDIVASASHEVARISHHLGFALVPASDATVLRHVDFVALDASRVLVVLVASGDQVWHKVVKTDEAMLPSDLVQAANYLNEQFAGQRLGDIRAEVLERMRQERVLYDQLMALAFRLACATLDNAATQPRLHVHGASSLVEESVAAHDVPMETLRAVFAMLEEKHRLIRLLNEYIEGPGLTVVIGGEHVAPDLRSFSLVASTAPGGTVVGVLGPRRMRYARAITAVDGLSRILGRVLAGERN
ncbi:MAG: hrcA [Acidobacteria bacterium]|jgi:heat-inducible transcriptional repressor|nr:hrcA [Acidobacteriota bacterium]